MTAPITLTTVILLVALAYTLGFMTCALIRIHLTLKNLNQPSTKERRPK